MVTRSEMVADRLAHYCGEGSSRGLPLHAYRSLFKDMLIGMD